MTDWETSRYLFVHKTFAATRGRCASSTRRTNIAHALKYVKRKSREARTKEYLTSSLTCSTKTRNSTESVSIKQSGTTDSALDEARGALQGAGTFLFTALGQGRLDPFNVYPTQDVPLYIHEIIDHGESLRLQKTLPHRGAIGSAS